MERERNGKLKFDQNKLNIINDRVFYSSDVYVLLFDNEKC